MTHIEIETSKVKGIIMKTVKIMPCLDMKDGRVVKGVHFVDLKDAVTQQKCRFVPERGCRRTGYAGHSSHLGKPRNPPGMGGKRVFGY
jgi:hypothetical protein